MSGRWAPFYDAALETFGRLSGRWCSAAAKTYVRNTLFGFRRVAALASSVLESLPNQSVSPYQCLPREVLPCSPDEPETVSVFPSASRHDLIHSMPAARARSEMRKRTFHLALRSSRSKPYHTTPILEQRLHKDFQGRVGSSRSHSSGVEPQGHRR